MGARSSVSTITLRSALLRAGVCLLFLAAILAARAPDALAHASFLDSTPKAGGRLESSPRKIVVRFTEPLNQSLSKTTLVDAATGRRLATIKLRPSKDEQLELGPATRLPRAPYRVDWHTVSTVDGHALEGSFGFGVRTAAASGEHEVEQSPLARNGWLRIAFRALFYAALFFFAGGLLNSVLLSRRQPPTDWLAPPELESALRHASENRTALAARAWQRTLDAGWLAAGAAAATALVEAADAGGNLTAQTVSDYLLTNAAGLARVGTVVAVAMAALLATRVRVAAAMWTLVALMTIALSGHANSANPRLAAVLTDWTHLVAASVWIGGIAQIVSTWLLTLRNAERPLRSAVMRSVLDRFGRVALPAFLVVVASGLVNALIELGRVEALWETSYGRVLAVKIALVGAVAIASYLHALRLRPRMLASNHPLPDRVERRHWRLLSSEPAIAICVVVAAAALVTFPLPPRQLGEADRAEARADAACNPCPLRAPGPDELAVAGQAGSSIAAFWLRRSGARLTGEVRLLDANVKPVDAPLRLLGGKADSCGIGCWRFDLSDAADVITVAVREKGREYRASVPARWQRAGNPQARRLTERAQRTMRSVRTLSEEERLTSGPGSFVRTRYRLRAPDRFTYSASSGARSIVIGKRQWDRVAGDPWQAGRFGGLIAFRTRDFFRWTVYARAARVLRTYEDAGRRMAEVALMDPATPVWYRLYVDLSADRVTADRMVTGAHFMSRRYFGFNAPVRIAPPTHSVRAR